MGRRLPAGAVGNNGVPKLTRSVIPGRNRGNPEPLGIDGMGDGEAGFYRCDSEALGFDRRLAHQHDGDVVLHRIDAVALRALQALRILAVLKPLLTRRTNQNIQ
jgi:hypothetical protein